MKRKIFDLQLFAEDPATAGAGADPAPAADPEPGKEPEPPKTEPPKPEAKYTDKDVDDIISRKFAEWEKKKEKEISQAEELANLNAQERAERERDQMKEELESLKRANTLNELTGTARKMLADQEVNVPDELLVNLVRDNAEDTKAAVNKFAEVFKEAVKKGIADALKGQTPKATGSSTMTKDDIMAVKNPIERQELIAKNMHLFQKGV